ncbi:serine hydrolase domain-containing protein [Cupriavidus pauculus]|uniref:serine hydrolase domain-containing protein n=1 Tax=Cupriavidus pauculus TaxID=82633 RepID=UPI001FD0DAA1|nr:serine hydrolase [Cupriavidus pauculus]
MSAQVNGQVTTLQAHTDAVPEEQVMAGFPPAPETRVGPTNWFKLPWLRWSLIHRSLSVPTVDIWRGDAAPSALPPGDALDGATVVTGPDGSEMELDQVLGVLEIDAFMVLHRGKVVFERYLHGMAPHLRHGSASISKSYLGIVAGILAHEGKLDLTATAESYVPEMCGTAMGGATLQQLLDMQAGIVRPDLGDRPSALGAQDGGVFEVLGLLPRRPESPTDFYDFVLKKPVAGRHGERLYYDNGQPEALAWVLRRVTGRSIADLMSTYLFQPMSTERDGFYSVDKTGAEFSSGGLSLTLRDLARFGETLRGNGFFNGRRIIPEAVLADIRAGGDKALFAESRFAAAYPGGSYRNYFYLSHDRLQGISAQGRYGQRLYVSPVADVVIAHFGAAPGQSPHPFEVPYARLHREIAETLMG